jgi:hypothetical protein
MTLLQNLIEHVQAGNLEQVKVVLKKYQQDKSANLGDKHIINQQEKGSTVLDYAVACTNNLEQEKIVAHIVMHPAFSELSHPMCIFNAIINANDNQKYNVLAALLSSLNKRYKAKGYGNQLKTGKYPGQQIFAGVHAVEKTTFQGTAFQFASFKNDRNLFMTLTLSHWSMPPLHEAVRLGNLSFILDLLKNTNAHDAINLLYKTNDYTFSVLSQVSENNLDILKLLLEDPRIKIPQYQLKKISKLPNGPLMLKVHEEKSEVWKRIDKLLTYFEKKWQNCEVIHKTDNWFLLKPAQQKNALEHYQTFEKRWEHFILSGFLQRDGDKLKKINSRCVQTAPTGDYTQNYKNHLLVVDYAAYNSFEDYQLHPLWDRFEKLNAAFKLVKEFVDDLNAGQNIATQVPIIVVYNSNVSPAGDPPPYSSPGLPDPQNFDRDPYVPRNRPCIIL